MPTIVMAKVKGKIDPSVGKKAYAFLEKLSENDTTPGLHIEPIANSADSRVRTGRVDQFYRAVLFKLVAGGGTTYVYLGIWPHDDAIAKARTAVLSVNPVNGVTEVRLVETTAPPPAAPPPPAHRAIRCSATRSGARRGRGDPRCPRRRPRDRTGGRRPGAGRRGRRRPAGGRRGRRRMAGAGPARPRRWHTRRGGHGQVRPRTRRRRGHPARGDRGRTTGPGPAPTGRPDHLRRHRGPRGTTPDHRGRRLRGLAGVPAPRTARLRAEDLQRAVPALRRRRHRQDRRPAAPRPRPEPTNTRGAGPGDDVHDQPGRGHGDRPAPARPGPGPGEETR